MTNDEREIERLKGILRTKVIAYRRLTDGRSYDCGANMVAYLNPAVGEAAREVNAAAAALKAKDPAFPASWTPYPEGN